MKAYLDNAATTPVKPEVIEIMTKALKDIYGNPNSIHKIGRDAEDALEAARKDIAETVHALGEEIVFTSGASEGNNHIIRSFIKEGAHFITSCTEHPSVLRVMEYAATQGVQVDFLSVDDEGRIRLSELTEKLTKNTSLVSIMMVNNETGAVNDIPEIAAVIRSVSRKAKFHVDAVQGYMKYALDVKKMDVDYMTVSAHKVHGPKGCGFVYMRKGQKPQSLLLGGEQERGFRAGTVNVPSILGFREAAGKREEDRREGYLHVHGLKKKMIELLQEIDGLKVNSPLESTSPFILSVSIPGMRGEVLLHYLSDEGVYVSTGSACTSKDTKDSHVLQAMGLSKKEIQGSIRLSFQVETTEEEIEYAAQKIKEAVKFLRRK
ncbi:cysteine desulfurase family protein [Proteiniclasticum sp. C24MP]|uniref:cysteine desulfurase family protein n=1 Tax=Proteiniclasticum sp. C24MP TaxID=3374101 RepID=UPI0037553E2E